VTIVRTAPRLAYTGIILSCLHSQLKHSNTGENRRSRKVSQPPKRQWWTDRLAEPPVDRLCFMGWLKRTNPPMQPFTIPIFWYSRSQLEMLKWGQKGRFPAQASAKTTRKDALFGNAATWSIVLHTMIEKIKHSYFQLTSFSLSQSSLPIDGKTAPFATFSTFRGPSEEEDWIVWNGCQWINCTWGDDGNDGPSTWYLSLSQSSGIRLHHFIAR